MRKRNALIDIPLGGLFRRLAGNPMIVIMFAITALALPQLDALELPSSGAPECNDPAGPGAIVRSEMIRLWLPEILIDPARHEPPVPVARTPQELRKTLERGGRDNLWYVITFRTHQANQEAVELSFIRYPCRDPESFHELVNALATIAGSPPRPSAADDTAVSLGIIPAGMSPRDWLESIRLSTL